jgi:hypothetical protein
MESPNRDTLHDAERVATKALGQYERNVTVLLPENFTPVAPEAREIFQQRLEEYHTNTERLRPSANDISQFPLGQHLALERNNELSQLLADRDAPGSPAAAENENEESDAPVI